MVIRTSLNGEAWWLRPDPDAAGTAGRWFEPAWFAGHQDSLAPVTVPSSWQVLKGLERYEGTCWYFTAIGNDALERAIASDDRVVRLFFNGANYLATAWFHGTRLGEHEGGFLPFEFTVPDDVVRAALDVGDRAILSVRVENTRKHDRVPEFSTDWFQWGGIYRDVYLDSHPAMHVRRCAVTPVVAFDNDGRLVRASVRIDVHGVQGTVFTWFITNPARVMIARGDHVLAGPSTTIVVPVENPLAWDPDHPRLYGIQLQAQGGEVLHASRFGLREVRAQGEAIMLNGKRVLLKGASLHEERLPHGREYPREQRRKDVLAMKAAGFNFLRTAHYTHDESLVDTCDELGMLVGEEIPVYWNIDYGNPRVLRLAARMLRDMVHRDYNHPSVIWWSAGNEIPVQRRECSAFFTTLLGLSKRLDTSRFSVYVTKAYLSDPARHASDLLLLNSYLGWYYLSERLYGFVVDMVHATAPRKPMLVSEFGAGAKLGFGRREPVNQQFSEWKQASLLGHAIKSFNARSHLSGWVIWIWRDFKSHMRLNEYQQGYNRKGLVDEQDRKKLAGVWMPRLVNARHRAPGNVRRLLAMFYSKFLQLPALLVGIIVDAVAPAFTKKRNEGYYTTSFDGDMGPSQ